MPSEWIIEDVCSLCCVWYKPGDKEEMACGGVSALERLGSESILPADVAEENRFENRFDKLLNELVCRPCPFLSDGCDFRDPQITDPELPCGGYVHLDRLLIDEIITEEQLKRSLSGRRK